MDNNLFHLTSESIEPEKILGNLKNAHAGALVTFEGWVRNHHEGRGVLRLEYEAYPVLAEQIANQLVKEIHEKYPITAAQFVHRTGALAVGEIAVWVWVTAVHRQEAFLACHDLIDQIKLRMPIWKKEFYRDGTSSWVNCQHEGSARHVHT